MFVDDKNKELKTELNGSGFSGGLSDEKSAAGGGDLAGETAEQTALNGAAIGENVEQAALSGAENKAEPSFSGAAENEQAEQKFYYQRDKNFMKKSNAKNALVFALLGLLLGPFSGVGIFFSVAGLAAGLAVSAKSTTKTWAVIVSIAGVILNAAFIAALVAALCAYGIHLPPAEGV